MLKKQISLSKKKFKKVMNKSFDEIKETIICIEDKCLTYFNELTKFDIDNVVDKVMDSIIGYNEPKIIIEHYLIIQRIKNDYHGNYSNGFFNKLFLKLYFRFPRTILALFIELPNYQFFYYFLIYIFENIDLHSIDDNCSLMRLYNVIILLYSTQLNKDYKTVKFDSLNNEKPAISNASLYAPCNKNFNIKHVKIMHKDIAHKLFGKYKESLTDYDNLIEILNFNIIVYQKKYIDFVFENELDLQSAMNCCFRIFYRNFKLEV